MMADTTNILDESAIMEAVLAQYRLPLDGWHGVAHWARVYQNGMNLAHDAGLDADQTTVVRLFAMLHDACRHDEYEDLKHGPRAVSFVNYLIENNRLPITSDQRTALRYAIRFHTEGMPKEGLLPEVEVCWDADRLDLDRVGIVPNKKYLTTKNDKFIAGARERAINQVAPLRILKQWGFGIGWKIG